MRRTSPWVVVGAACIALLAGWLADAPAAPGIKGKEAAGLDKDAVLYLGCGEVGGPGTVVQLDRTGKVLGTRELSGTPYGLAATRDGLVAAIPARGNAKVVRIDRAGKVETLIQDADTLPAPIAVAADPATGDVLVADNGSDVLMRLPGGKADGARTVLQIQGHKVHAQDMSVAFDKDGHLLFGGSGPVGVFRFKDGKDAALGAPLLKERAGVAADPGSKRWVAATAGGLHVFEADREVAALAYPAGRRMWHEAVAFGPGGAPIVVLHLGGTRYEVVQADLEAKEFKVLFGWAKSRVVSLAVGPKLPWKE